MMDDEAIAALEAMRKFNMQSAEFDEVFNEWWESVGSKSDNLSYEQWAMLGWKARELN